MDSTFILPFVDSIQSVFEMMLQLPVQVGSPVLKQGEGPNHDVSGIIGLSGDVEGSVVLSFPTAAAERIVSTFTGMELAHTHEDFSDAIGELVNMISGGAKAKFVDKTVSISCPSVVIGEDHKVSGRKDVVCIVIPCKSDCGEFSVEVSIRKITGENPAQKSAQDSASVSA